MSTCSRVITAPNPISAPVAPNMNDSRMKLSLPVSSVIFRGSSSRRRAVSTNRRASNDASLIATTPSTDAIARSVSGSKFRPGERRLELEQDQRQPDLGDRLVVLDRHARVERLAEVGRDREAQERVRAGRLELGRLADRRLRRGAGEAGDDRQVGRVADDLDDPDLLVVGQVRPLAGVDVDRERDRPLAGDPADVRAEGGLVDPAVGVHRQDRGRDEAVEVEGHRLLREIATRAGPDSNRLLLLSRSDATAPIRDNR